MFDPLTMLGAVALASSAMSAGALMRGARAGAELVQLEAPPIGQALDRAFNCGCGLPADMAELVDLIDAAAGPAQH
jgi:hypothetical protein